MNTDGLVMVAGVKPLFSVVALVEVFGFVPFVADLEGVHVAALFDDAEMHLGKSKIEADKAAQRRDEGYRPSVHPFDADVIFDLRFAELLVDLGESLHLIVDIPTTFAGFDEPIEQGLTVFIAPGAGVEELGCFIQDNHTVFLFVDFFGIVPLAERFHVLSGRVIR